MLKLPTKMPAEVWKCSVDLTPWTATGGVVQAIAMAPSSGSVTVGSASLIGPNEATFNISGGVSKTTNTFTLLATMADGQVFGQSFSVIVFE